MEYTFSQLIINVLLTCFIIIACTIINFYIPFHELYLKTSPNGTLKQESISEVIDLITLNELLVILYFYSIFLLQK